MATAPPNCSARNTIRIPLRVPHVILRIHQVIVQKLRPLRLLQRQMVFHDNTLHEMLVDDFPVPLPCLSVVRDEDMIAAGDEVVGDVAVGAVAIDAGFLVEKLLYQFAVGEHDAGGGAELEGEDAAKGFGPFGESGAID